MALDINPTPVAQEEIHAKVRDIVRTLLIGRQPEKVKVLDAAAGNGYMTKWLIEQELDVTPLDLSCDDWKVPEVKCFHSDFNKNIDVSDNAFDISISIETIEHLENPFHFIRELARVTKPNGTIIITTPNIHSVRSRIKYFFSGLPTLFEYVNDDNMGQHISPVSIGQFLYSFNMTRLKLIDIHTTGPKISFAVSMCFSLINGMAWQGVKILKAKRSLNTDHYLNVLSVKQLRELNRDVSLIVVAKKIA